MWGEEVEKQSPKGSLATPVYSNVTRARQIFGITLEAWATAAHFCGEERGEDSLQATPVRSNNKTYQPSSNLCVPAPSRSPQSRCSHPHTSAPLTHQHTRGKSTAVSLHFPLTLIFTADLG